MNCKRSARTTENERERTNASKYKIDDCSSSDEIRSAPSVTATRSSRMHAPFTFAAVAAVAFVTTTAQPTFGPPLQVRLSALA